MSALETEVYIEEYVDRARAIGSGSDKLPWTDFLQGVESMRDNHIISDEQYGRIVKGYEEVLKK